MLDSTQLVEHQSIFTPGMAISEDSESIHQRKSMSMNKTSKVESPHDLSQITKTNNNLLIKSQESIEVERTPNETPIQECKLKLSEKLRDMEEHMRAISTLRFENNGTNNRNDSLIIKCDETKEYEDIELSTLKVIGDNESIENETYENKCIDVQSSLNKSHHTIQSVISIQSPISGRKKNKSFNNEIEDQQAGQEKFNVDIKAELEQK